MSATSSARVRGAALREQAVAHRLAGRSYRAIADALGISTTMAFKHVTTALRAIRERTAEDAEALRTLELERLDVLLSALWPAAEAGDTASVDRVVKLMERRAKLCGLDMPSRMHLAGDAAGAPIEVSVTPPIDPTKLSDEELESLSALLDKAQQTKGAGDSA